MLTLSSWTLTRELTLGQTNFNIKFLNFVRDAEIRILRSSLLHSKVTEEKINFKELFLIMKR